MTRACFTATGVASHATRDGKRTLCGRKVAKLAPELGEATCYRCRPPRRGSFSVRHLR